MKQKPETKMFTSAKKLYKTGFWAICGMAILCAFVLVKNKYTNADFGNTFGNKALTAEKRLASLKEKFDLCGKLCNKRIAFMQSIVFPEVMRYNTLKDDIETESLRTLYVQFGEDYSNFSVGLFQMKPSFAQVVETKAKQLLTDSIYNEMQLAYFVNNAELVREERVKRLQETDWQLIYLTAFICICDRIYLHQIFTDEAERMQWYATVYNTGFNKTDAYISQKIKQQNFYLKQNMPGNKFSYAAIAGWFYNNAVR